MHPPLSSHSVPVHPPLSAHSALDMRIVVIKDHTSFDIVNDVRIIVIDSNMLT